MDIAKRASSLAIMCVATTAAMMSCSADTTAPAAGTEAVGNPSSASGAHAKDAGAAVVSSHKDSGVGSPSGTKDSGATRPPADHGAGSADAGHAATTDGGHSAATDGGHVASTDAAAPGDDAGQTGGGIEGMYGTAPIKPIVAGLWIGMAPFNGAETGGGPFVYLFSGPIKCADISKMSGWQNTLPAGTQILEMLIGTSMPGTTVTVGGGAGPGKVEVNYSTSNGGLESSARSGTVTLTAYTAGMSLDGKIDVKFASGSAAGTFHADWCPTGMEF